MDRPNPVFEVDVAAPPGLRPRSPLFWAALALTVSVFPLIWMGGLVTSHQAGLSVPDWPNSYGYNMVLFPPSLWVGGIFYEHTHRLLGTLSGFLATILLLMAWAPAATPRGRRGWAIAAAGMWTVTVLAVVFTVFATRGQWLSTATTKLLPHFAVGFGSLAVVATLAWLCRRREPRRWVRWLTVGVFVAVCVQGAMGGLRVVLADIDLAVVHGCFAEAFFALAAFTTLACSKWWARVEVEPVTSGSTGRGSIFTAGRLAGLTTLLIFCQLVAGALMRHYGAGLAIPGVLVYGKLLPPTDPAALDAINSHRAWVQHLPPLASLTQLWLHFAHRVGATLVTLAICTTAWQVFRKFGTSRAAGRTAVILSGLLVTQVTLGVLTVYTRKSADVASAHVAVGALTLMTAAVLTAVLARQAARRPANVVPPTPVLFRT